MTKIVFESQIGVQVKGQTVSQGEKGSGWVERGGGGGTECVCGGGVHRGGC